MDRSIRHKKLCKVVIVSTQTIWEISTGTLKRGALRPSVFSLPCQQIRHWRKENYSSRYLLYESLVANKFSSFSRLYQQIRHKKLYKVVIVSSQPIWEIQMKI